jgi:hypothetical protein
VEWPRGEATACKAVYTGSNPVSTSEALSFMRAISSVGERYLDTVEVTGSIPVSPTTRKRRSEALSLLQRGGASGVFGRQMGVDLRTLVGRRLLDRAPAENLIHAAQAACRYSWRIPPKRWCLRMSMRAIWSGSVIGGGSGWSGRALEMP